MPALEKLEDIKTLSGGTITGAALQMTIVVSSRTVNLPDWLTRELASRLLPDLPMMLRSIAGTLNTQAAAELDAAIVIAQNNLTALRQKREKLEDPAMVRSANSHRPE